MECPRIEIRLLPGARGLLAEHSRELPQRDDLCGAFCGALALQAAGVADRDGEVLDQDTVALASGSIVSAHRHADVLPHGEPGRRDYRLSIPQVQDEKVSGTTAPGLIAAIEQLSAGALVAIPHSGPWNARTLDGLFDLASGCSDPVTLVGNLATRHLWGSQVRMDELLDYLIDGDAYGPPADWDVGHFVCIVGCAEGVRGRLYAVADTYPSLGIGGVHLQPRERLAIALERRDMPAGGVIAVVSSDDAEAIRAGAHELGLHEGLWDNGSVAAEKLA